MAKFSEEDLTALVRLIEQKLNWGEGDDWSVHEFEALREKILADTGQVLSVTTLKRVWGKAKQENSPSKSTLNILAQFAGFENWNHFREGQGAPEKPIKTETFWRRNWWLGLLLLLPVLGVLLQSNLFRTGALSQGEINRIVFSARPTSDSFPNTVNFQYDIGELESSDFEIQTSSSPDKTIGLRQKKGNISDLYYYPGYFHAQLLYKGEPVKKQSFQLATNAWQALIKKSSLNFPIYLSDDQIRQDSILGLLENNFEALNQSQDYITVQLVNLSDEPRFSGNNFSFSSIFRLASPFDNSPCKVTTIILHSNRGNISFGFGIPGCTGDLNFDFLGENISGNTVDLAGFGISPKKWINLKALNQDKQFTISVNGTSLLEYAHNKDIGRIGGVSFVFDGIGEIKQAELVDPDRQEALF